MPEVSATEIAQQVAQAVSEAIRQASAETTRQVIDASRTAASQEVGAEREFETGLDEAFKQTQASQAGFTNENERIVFANMKRTYDEFQHESLESVRRNRSYVDKVLSDAAQHDAQRQLIATQALQNAVETANMVGKQAVRHSDIAIDQQWNPIQQGAGDTLTARAVSIDDASLKAIGATVAAAVANALSSASKPSA
jgi:hypothetical protein